MPESSLPCSDIIIPFHNALRFMRPCLQSLFLSTRAPFKLWLIDDASNGVIQIIQHETAATLPTS